MSLLAELRRRNVIRMAGLYLVGAWLLVQVAGTVLPMFGAPDWLPRSVVVLLALGFVPALIFAWVFEMTPDGIKRDADVPPEASIAPQTAQRMNRMIIAVLALALLYFGFDKFVLAPAREAARDATRDAEAAKPVVPSPTKASSEPVVPLKSIAVLPFADLSPGHDQEYFSDGMAEEILDALAQVQDLKVAGRTSSFYFKGKNETVQTIGRTLGVAHVLEGSVRKQGEKVRITAQLIQTADGFHLWSESYDGDLEDVFELQESIARAITEQLKVILLDAEKSQLAQASTSSTEAHQQFLRGRYFWNLRGLENLNNAAAAFKAAVAADPEYADAWAGLAQTYAILPEYSVNDAASTGKLADTLPQALAAADQALRLDSRSSRALSVRAYIKAIDRFDWAGAESDYRAAIASDPRDATAHQWYGEMLMYQRRWSEAFAQFDAAIALEPLAQILHAIKGISLVNTGDPAAALASLDESLKLAPGAYIGLNNKVMALVKLRRFDEAAALASGLPERQRTLFLGVMSALKDPSRTQAVVDLMIAAGPGGGSFMDSQILMMLGRDELALQRLERMARERHPYRVYISTIVDYDPLRGNPRFDALLKALNLPVAVAGQARATP